MRGGNQKTTQNKNNTIALKMSSSAERNDSKFDPSTLNKVSGKMNCRTVQELEDHFICSLENLSMCLDLSSVAQFQLTQGSECRERLSSISKDLCDMDAILMDLRMTIKTKKEELTAAEGVKCKIDELLKDLNHMKENLPHHLQQVKREEEPLERFPLQERYIQEDTYILPQLPKVKKKNFPRLDFIMKDEFTSVPKYMKGRISYEQLNSMVEVINEAIRKKYQLLSKPKSQLSDKQMKLYTMYKEQETKDTKGTYFFTTEDLTRYCGLKNDSSVRSRLTILRHCTRLREIRGGGLTRLALIV